MQQRGQPTRAEECQPCKLLYSQSRANVPRSRSSLAGQICNNVWSLALKRSLQGNDAQIKLSLISGCSCRGKEAESARLGRWIYDHFRTSYLHQLPVGIMLVQAGFKDDRKGYCLPRGRVHPLEDEYPGLAKQIFPWADEELRKVKQVHLRAKVLGDSLANVFAWKAALCSFGTPFAACDDFKCFFSRCRAPELHRVSLQAFNLTCRGT